MLEVIAYLLTVSTSMLDAFLELLLILMLVGDKKPNKKFAAIWILMGTLLCLLMNYLEQPFMLKSILFAMLFYMYCIAILRLSVGAAVLLPALFMALVYVCEFAVMALAKAVFEGGVLADLEQTTPYQIFCMIVSRAFLFAVVGVLLLIKQRFIKERAQPQHLNRPYWVVLCSAVAAFGSIVGVLGFGLTLRPELLEDILHWFTFLFAIIFIIFFALILRIMRETERQYHLEAELRQTERQLLRQDELKAMHEQSCGLRHDFKNHLQIVAALAEQGRIAELREYLGELPAEQGGDGQTVETGNTYIDTLVNAKMVVAQSHGIAMEADICFPESVQIAASDLCSILFNLLDNAIEACEGNEQSENRCIRLTLRQQKGFLLIACENPSERTPQMEKGGFKSSKSGGLHGVGLGQLRRIAARYDGMFDANYENSVFHARLLLPNETESDRFYVSRVSVRPEGTSTKV